MTLNNQLKLSQMVLSCLNFGTKTDKKRAFDLLDEFLEQGRTFLDTSNNYSFGFDDSRGGVSEQLGQWLTERNQRDRVLLGTKKESLENSTKSVSIKKHSFRIMTALQLT